MSRFPEPCGPFGLQPSPKHIRGGLLKDFASLSIPAVTSLTGSHLVRELRDLIAALDRRAPQVGRAGEASIARDAAALRVKALKRIAELEGQDRLSRLASAPGRKPTTAR